jgi:3-phosphoshikimate 1-carboxyvinyltransferase
VANKVIVPARALSGGIVVPGDKSISHRLAILASLAEGTTEIRNYSPAADCASTLGCLKRLGVKIETGDRKARARGQTSTDQGHPTLHIRGAGLGAWQKPRRTLDAQNSGTTMRLLAGALAGQGFSSRLDGDSSLRRRPMRRVIEPLERMGAQIRARGGGFAPLEFTGAGLRPIEFTLPVASAQVKSAVLLAGLFAAGTTAVIEPVRTRDHTEIALAEFGASVRRNGPRVEITGGSRLTGREIVVPGDLSSAVFFLAAALILPGSKLMLLGVGLNPTRSAVLDFLAQMGAPVRVARVEQRFGELVGDIEVSSPEGAAPGVGSHSLKSVPLVGGKIAGADVPRMIDELPMLAALAPYTEEGIEIRDAAELRVKESDRIIVLAENLRRMGAHVEQFPDGIRVAGRAETGSRGLRGAEVDPHGDHRLAMALAVAALGATGPTAIRGAECVAVSYPAFFEDLEAVVER